MSNRAPITTEDTAGAPAPLEPGSVVAGPTPGYYQLSAPALAGTSVAAVPSTVPLRDTAAGFEVGYLAVDTTPAVAQTGAPGKVIWNDTQGTLEFQLKGGVVNLQVGQEQVLRVRNLEGTPLVDGEVVYVAGSSGTHNDVRRADANLESTSSLTIGVVTEPIAAHPGEGFVNTFGMVTCDTNHLTEGAAVWLSTVAGATTSTRPTAPDHAVLIGFCVKKAGAADGRIFVTINNGYELSELHDVLIGAQAEGDILAWDNTTKVWRNKVPSTQPWVLKAGDTMSGPLSITNPSGTALTVTDVAGTGELALKARTSAATSTAAQAGMDYGFSAGYRVTQAVAGSALASPFGASAYMYAAGVPLRFITDNIARGVEFWAGSVYAGRAFNGTMQFGAAPSGTSTGSIPLYCGKASATVQMRVGDLSGNCWSIGRDNISSGDLIIEPTAPAGTTPYAAALRVLLGSGKTQCTYGLILPKTVGTGIQIDPASPSFGWRDMLGEIVARGTGVSNPTWTAFRSGIYAYQFASATINEVWTQFHIPHDWIPGSNLYAHVHWGQNIVDTGGTAGVPGAAKWYFELTYADGYGTAGGAADPFAAPLTVSVVQQASTTQYGHMIAEVQCGTAGGAGGTMLNTSTIEVDGLILCRLWRDKTDPADTLDQGPFIFMCDLHYQTNGVLGTKQRNPPFYT